MADSKITALTSISTSTDPANDPLVIVDVSDTSMAATGTTKKVTLNQLLGASGTATLASATISGDLTVDTSTLKVDSANDRVGIGTATPVNTLEVVAPAGDNIVSTFRSGDATAANNAGGGFRSISSATAANRVAQVWLDADGANFSGGDYFFIQKNGGSGTVEFNQSSNAAMVFLTNSTERYRIASDGVATWSNVGGVAGTAMTLNSTGLGVGGSPASKLSVFAGADGDVGFFRGGSTRQLQIGTSATAGYLNADNGSAGFELRVNGTARAYFDTSGNVGIGVTPSAKLDVRGPNNGNQAIFTGTVNRGLVISTRSDSLADDRTVIFNAAYAAGSLGQLAFQTAGTDRVLMKNNGQLRFVPLAADPAGAEAGDVYYNSTSNKLKCYNGTTWNDLF